jgi:hypothetical protein
MAYLDRKLVLNKRISVLASERYGQEIWLNARNILQLDGKFRGSIKHLFIFADHFIEAFQGKRFSAHEVTKSNRH